MSDVLLFQTNNDGDISVVNGTVQLTDKFNTMVYLCLFGGNRLDDTNADNNLTWWANTIIEDEAEQQRSLTQHLVETIPLTSGNLLRIRNAVLQDLNVFITSNIANSVTAEVSIPQVNRVQIDIAIIADGKEEQFSFTENWLASA